MDSAEKQRLIEKMLVLDGIKLIREEAIVLSEKYNAEECLLCVYELYYHSDFRVQELAVFLAGYIATACREALLFLWEKVSRNGDWRIQEILAMAFDSFCKAEGYEKALPVIEEWLRAPYANQRRAVTEGLRIWTARPYFKDYPEKAIAILSSMKTDESDYVRRSAGNALKDIGKRYPALVQTELDTWDLSLKEVMSVYKLASWHIKGV